ncbi:MAG: hypothetical protein AB1861_13585, partial [Cyanobacteriota bacterium]
MVAFSINSERIINLAIHEPLHGVWHADVETDSEITITGAVSITDSITTWNGTVLRGAVEHGKWVGRIVGGAGKMSKVL